MSETLNRLVTYVIFVGAAYAVMVSSWPVPEVPQPAAFPHAKHVALNIHCVACHTGAQSEKRAGLPSTETCALCHRVDRPFPPTPPELATFMLSKQEISWVQVQRVPRHVYFSHRRHVKVGKVDCEKCHGAISAAVQAVTRSYFPSGEPGMMQCVDCHRRENVTTDCLSCHH